MNVFVAKLSVIMQACQVQEKKKNKCEAFIFDLSFMLAFGNISLRSKYFNTFNAMVMLSTIYIKSEMKYSNLCLQSVLPLSK